MRCSTFSNYILDEGGKKNSKRSILVVSDDTYILLYHIYTYIIYKRSITFQVCSFYCARDFFLALCKMLYDLKYCIHTYNMFETFNYIAYKEAVYLPTDVHDDKPFVPYRKHSKKITNLPHCSCTQLYRYLNVLFTIYSAIVACR